jgi:plastocyanin
VTRFRSVAPLPSIARPALVALVVLATAGTWLVLATAPVRGADHSVAIQDFAFGPADLTVAVGDTVTWTNNDSAPHTVTSSSGPTSFDSGNLATGGTFSFTFDTAGTYAYFCEIHPDMTGTITVTAAAATTAPSASAVPNAATDAPVTGAPALVLGVIALLVMVVGLGGVIAHRRL